MSVENLKKHVGQLANTGVRVAVVYRKLPNDEKSCVIVETERLPDSYHDTIMQCLNSKEAAETNDFCEVLHRRTFPDGLNCLIALHQRAYMRKEPVSNVIMYPLPGQAVPLALINATIDNTLDQYNKQTTPQTQTQTQAPPPISAEQTLTDAANVDLAAIAKGLILEAEILEKNAAAKREEAYQLVPELKPGRGRPALPEDEKAIKLEERKLKRKERDQRKAAESKIEQKEAMLAKKVADKIARDQARINQEA